MATAPLPKPMKSSKHRRELYQRYLQSLKSSAPSIESLIAWDKSNGRELLDWNQGRNIERGLAIQARSLILSMNIEYTSEKDSLGMSMAVTKGRFEQGRFISAAQSLGPIIRRLEMLAEHSAIRLKHHRVGRASAKTKMMAAVNAGINQAYGRNHS